MQDLVKSHLNDVSKVRFMCPYTGCGAEWPFAAVRHVAMMKPEELKPIEKRLNLNYLRLQDEYRRCPGCKNWLAYILRIYIICEQTTFLTYLLE